MPNYDPSAFPSYSPTSNPMDPGAINQALQANYAALGITPGGVGSGPGDINYYAGKIADTGGLTQSNWNYWFGPNARIASDVGGGGGAAGGGAASPFGGGGGGAVYPFSSPFGGNPQLAPYQTPPAYVPPPAFQMPTADQVSQMPGFQFNLQQGLGAYSNQRAGQGLWATGATGKGMADYAENLANTYYQDYFNNSLQQYNTNLQSQYLQPYEINLQSQYQTPYELNMQAQQGSFGNQLALWQDYFNQKYLTGGLLSNYQMQ